ncbi:hypothetical protein GQ55_7G071800 [Panicum hallii var. hallii]|uniref:Uncharacterized protein n=1 Tax=Panicum hallii var. hallii TaxID=1504633 RepID=A0A2T7CSR2_9POAL|nr:hypothetical protein GQ55_7G071800 [Panicum hallii var. hallii]
MYVCPSITPSPKSVAIGGSYTAIVPTIFPTPKYQHSQNSIASNQCGKRSKEASWLLFVQFLRIKMVRLFHAFAVAANKSSRKLLFFGLPVQ